MKVIFTIVFEIKILLEIVEANFISLFEFPIVLRMGLNSIIRQMDVRVFIFWLFKFRGRCSDIAFSAPISSDRTANLHQQYKAPDIKFSVIVQKWLLNILLNNKGCFFIFFETIHDIVLHFFRVIMDHDSITSICIFSGLNDPNLVFFFFDFLQ